MVEMRDGAVTCKFGPATPLARARRHQRNAADGYGGYGAPWPHVAAAFESCPDGWCTESDFQVQGYKC